MYMKRILSLLVVVQLITLGCKSGSKGVTHLDGNSKAARLASDNPAENKPVEEPKGLQLSQDENITSNSKPTQTDPQGDLADPHNLGNMAEDREMFKANTVYFEYDRAAVQPSETAK